MGLDVNGLVQARPEDFFDKFAEALSKVESQNQRAAIATRVMGRAGAEQIPVILELAEKHRQLKEQGVSDDAIKQLDKFGDSLTRLKNSAIGLAEEGLAAIIRGFDRLFSISDIEKARRDLAGYGAEIDSINQTLQRREQLRQNPITNFFTVPSEKDAELLSRRADAQKNLFDATDRLMNLMRGEQDKPPVGGGGFGPDPEALQKIQEALGQARAKLEQLQLANAQAARTAGDLTVNVRALALALIEQEKNAALAAATQNKTLTPALRGVIEAEAEEKTKQFDAAEAALKRKDALQVLTGEIKVQTQAESDRAALAEAHAKGDAELLQRKIDAINLEQQLANIEGDRLVVIGRTSEAERLRLTSQIAYLQKIKEIEDATPGGKDTSARVAQIQLAQTKLQQLGVASVNVGQQITGTVNDIFTAAIQGTLKLSDIGKSLLAGVARTAGDWHNTNLNKKLGFENILLTNMQGLPGQMNNALSQGVQSVGGGLLNLFFGGGGGSIPIPGGSGGSVGGPVGSSTGGGGGFGGGIIGSIFSTIGSLWSTFSSTTLGATIASSIASFTSTVATTISSTLSTVAALPFATIPIIGWIIAAVIMLANGIYRIIANQQERPNAKFSGNFEGVSFDPTMQQFVPGDINVQIGRKSGIKNSQAGAIAKTCKSVWWFSLSSG